MSNNSNSNGGTVTERDCRERTDEILAKLARIESRLFVDNGTLSFQTVLRSHTEAIASIRQEIVKATTSSATSYQSRTWSDVGKEVACKAPYATVALVALILLHQPAAKAASALLLRAIGGPP